MYALLGMFVMIFGHNFLVIYLGLELLTLSSYALVALRRDDLNATEAAMKYFVLGALGQWFPALWLVHGLRRDGFARFVRRHASHRWRRRDAQGLQAGAGVGPGVCGGRSGVQAGRGAVPHVGA